MAEIFPNLAKEMHSHVQEAQRVPNKMNPRRPTPRHTIIEKSKVKNETENLKSSSKKKTTSYIGGSPSACQHKTIC